VEKWWNNAPEMGGRVSYSCKVHGATLVYSCVGVRNTLEVLRNEEESNCEVRKSKIYKIWSYSIVVVGRNADFVEVGEG